MPPSAPTYRRPVGYLEAFLMGGLSILTYLCFVLFVEKGASVYEIASFAFALAFIVNYPHFMASYYILYKDNASKLLTTRSYMWAGIIAPGVLLASLISVFVFKEKAWLGYMTNIMFFTVGWHYVKQIFGCLVVSNIFKQYFYGPFERGVILFNLYALWWVSWLPANMYGNTFNYYSLQYTGLNISKYVHDGLQMLGIQTNVYALGKLIIFISFVSVAVSLAYIIFFHISRYVTTKKIPHLAGILAFATIYIWYIPVFSHPSYAYVIPFLHSLQYLAFVRIYRLNLEEDVASSAKNEVEKRRKVITGLSIFTTVTIVLGALVFSIIPNYLDKEFSAVTLGLGAQAYLISFILFINIHHYFIDNVIWKKDNDLVRKYLFGK